MATLDEIIDEQNKIHEELERMSADESTTEEADGGIRDTLVARWKGLDADREKIVARMEELNLIRKASQDRAGTESGDGGGAWTGSRGPEFMARRDPLAGREESKDYAFLSRADQIARASTLVELHDKRGLMPGRGEAATRSAQNPAIARHMLMFGGDDYYDAFTDYVNDPTGPGLQRAAGALTLAAAQGGYLLPYFLDPTIVLTTDGTSNPYRQLASVKQITTNLYQGVNSAGVQAAWLDESATAGTAAYQGVGRINVYVKKAAAWVYGTLEANEDTDFATQLPGMIQDAKDVLEETAFATSTGANTDNTGAPRGVLAGLGTAQRVAAAGSGAIAAGDIYNLEAALGARFRRQNTAFAANITTINKIRNASPSGAGSSFWATMGDGTPSRLLNHRIEESPSLTSAAGTGTGSSGTASAQAVFGAWNNFYIVDRIGMSMLYDPMLKDVTSGTPKGQQGWFAFWRTGSDVATVNAFRYLAYA